MLLLSIKNELQTEIKESEAEMKEMIAHHEEEITKLKTNHKEYEAKWKVELDIALEAAEQVVLQSEFLKIKSELEQEIKSLKERAKELESRGLEKQPSTSETKNAKLDLLEIIEKKGSKVLESPRLQTAVRKVYHDDS